MCNFGFVCRHDINIFSWTVCYNIRGQYTIIKKMYYKVSLQDIINNSILQDQLTFLNML